MRTIATTARRPMPAVGETEPAPRAGWLYDFVAAGMRAYAGARFDVRVFGAERLTLEPGTLVVSTHRSDDDVPLLCGSLYFAARLWRRRGVRATFAVRDDLFEPGFFAGYPHGVPLALRRLVWPVGIGRVLRTRLGCLPIRSATSMRLVQLLRQVPSLPLEQLPDGLAAAAERRAAALGRPLPRSGGELLRPEYADLLWPFVHRGDLDAAELAAVWRRRAGASIDDLRRLVAVVRGGGRLLLFPEGHPSPDGTIGPLLPGFSTLIRRGGASRIQPIALAYDPLVAGRPRAYVSVGESFAPRADGQLEARLLEALRRATPLTAGQLAARAALDGGRLPSRVVANEVERALGERRPVEPGLRGAEPHDHPAGLVAAARAAPARAARLAREYESARLDGPDRPG